MSIYECDIYACRMKDKNELEKSTSGGVFFVLAKQILSEGGIVFGAGMNSDFSVSHRSAETEEELNLIRRSKYMQSRIGNTYLETEKWLKRGRKVLFSGTPCQTAGLYSFLKARGNETLTNLCSVNVICAGVPSTILFRKYICEKEESIGSVKEVAFRDKRNNRKWGDTFLHLTTTFGEYECSENDDYFGIGFNTRMITRPSCDDCHFRGMKSKADISIGDYWGIQETHPEFYCEQGNSVVILKTKKGKEFFDRCHDRFYVQKSDAVSYNIVVTAT